MFFSPVLPKDLAEWERNLSECERLVAELRYQLSPLRKYRDLKERREKINARRRERYANDPGYCKKKERAPKIISQTGVK
jgi:hypothetical protein